MGKEPAKRDPKQGIENWLINKAKVIDQEQRDLCIKLFIEQTGNGKKIEDIYAFISMHWGQFVKWIYSNTIEIEY